MCTKIAVAQDIIIAHLNKAIVTPCYSFTADRKLNNVFLLKITDNLQLEELEQKKKEFLAK